MPDALRLPRADRPLVVLSLGAGVQSSALALGGVWRGWPDASRGW